MHYSQVVTAANVLWNIMENDWKKNLIVKIPSFIPPVSYEKRTYNIDELNNLQYETKLVIEFILGQELIHEILGGIFFYRYF